jgi:hypothetical protein
MLKMLPASSCNLLGKLRLQVFKGLAVATTADEMSNDEAALSAIIQANTRPWNSYWYWRDKPTGERGAARDILTQAGIVFEDLKSLPEGMDPPDCEASIDGRLTGIEVTELVHRKTLEIAIKADKSRAAGKLPDRLEAHFVWTKTDLVDALRSRIRAKDGAVLKGGPYTRYILAIYTDETFLDFSAVDGWLASESFPTNTITDVLFGFSYEPARNSCPVVRLRVLRSG